MRRAAILAAALLMPAALAGCAPDSDPAADSLGRVEAMTEKHAEDAITLQPEVEGAPTIEFFAPVETEFEVTLVPAGPASAAPSASAFRPGFRSGPFVPESIPAGDVNISLTTAGNHNLALTGPGLPVALLWGTLAGRPEKDLMHSVRLLAGSYTYYCAVPGHRNAGMVGQLNIGSTPALPSPSPAST
ncbi:MAG TPA: hypothetical protein VNA14_10500 [Mycobacteriales bacterium]|nr:hypothetical protein [Mycobacteriales bacterium]